MKSRSSVEGYSKTFPVTFDKVDSFHMYDTTGKQYIDFFTGAGTLNYGHNPKVSTSAIIDYLNSGRVVHSLDLDTVAKLEFFDTFEKTILDPRGLDMKIQLVSPSGTNSVEAAFKLARKVKEKKLIFAFKHAFHGMTLGSLGATYNSYYKNNYTPKTEVKHFPFNSLVEIRESLVSGFIPAAIVLETVQADGGINVASVEFLQELRQLCDDHGILLIVDDIQVGNGRTGNFFSFERANIKPDIICISKGIAGGMPMSLMLYKSELDCWKTGEHSGTFRGNNLAFVASTSLLKEYWSDDKFSKEIKRKEDIMSQEINKISKFNKVRAVRGCGMIHGIELDTHAEAVQVRSECFKRGLILELVGEIDNVLKLMPPLVIDDETLIKGIDIVKSVLEDM